MHNHKYSRDGLLDQTGSSGRHGWGDEGASYTITEECERLFCDTPRHVFLGEGKAHATRAGSLVMGTKRIKAGANVAGSESAVALDQTESLPLKKWIEVWDYVGGASFRGFVAESDFAGQRALFVFLEEAMVANDLKHGYVLPFPSHGDDEGAND